MNSTLLSALIQKFAAYLRNTLSATTCFVCGIGWRHLTQLAVVALLVVTQTAWGQTLTLTDLSPARNARSAPAASNVSVGFDQPLSTDPASLTTLRVFSAQRGGLLRNGQGGTTSVSSKTITFTPTTAFRPGETVFSTVLSSLSSTSGASLVRGQVQRFTVQTGGTGPGTFILPTTNPNPAVGSNPISVAVGDVDGDGDLDLLAANSGSNAVSVLLNNGAGNFTAPAVNPNPAVGTSPRSVAVGDVDGDGDLDLLAANSGSNTVSVLLNNGTGIFTSSANVAVGTSPSSVALGDLDGDGDLDFVAANINSTNVSVRLNDGTGTFTGSTNVAVGTQPYGIALGDVDGDGDLDFVTANYGSNAVSVLLNNGAGIFTAPATNPNPAVGTYPYSVAVGDVDGDGDLDLLTANVGSNTVSVRLNDGTGIFTGTTNVAVGSNPYSVAVGDMDGDGDLDLLTANYTSNNVSVRLNQPLPLTITGFAASPATRCAGSVASFSATVGNITSGYSFTLTNGSTTLSNTTASTSPAFSQTLTAAGTGTQSFTLTVAQNGVSTTATTPLTVNAVPSLTITANPSLTITSGNSVALTASGASTYLWSSGQATAAITVAPTSTTAYSVTGTSSGCSSVTSVTVTSVTVTGTTTLLITGLSPDRNARSAPASSTIAIAFDQPLSTDPASLTSLRVFSAQRGGLIRNGQGGTTTVSSNTISLAPTTVFQPGETVLTTVLSTLQSTTGSTLARGQVQQFTVGVGGTGRGNFITPATNPNPAVSMYPYSVALGDVDGDGDLDLLTANYYSNNVSVRLNDGTGNFTAPATNPNPAVSTYPLSVALGDVDGDGDLDFVTANYGSGNVSVRLNDGTGNFTGTTNVAVGSGPYSVALGDVDGDGDLDLLAANFYNAIVSVRLNNGKGNFTGTTNVAVDLGPYSVALGDVDGDGDLDFVTANYGNRAGNVSVRLNDGMGNFTAPATNPNPAVGSGPTSVALGDVDGDGDLDLLTANYESANVSVRLNDGTGNFTAPTTNPNPAVGSYPKSVALGDVDRDGDLDFVATDDGGVSVRLNDGMGNFTAPAPPINPNPVVGFATYSVALGDVDGDGDLDFVTTNEVSNNVSVRLNQPLPLTITGFAASPATRCAGSVASFSATVGNITSGYSFTLTNGSTTLSNTTASTSPAFSQTLTAAGTGTQSFTLTVAQNGVSTTATTPLTVNAVPSLTITANPSLTITSGNSVALTASGASTYLWSSGQATAAITVAPTSTTAYSVTGTSSGCSSVTSVTVTVNAPAPTISGFSSTLNPVCAGSVTTFTATVGNVSGSYSFTLSNGTVSVQSTASSTAFSQTLVAGGSGPQTFMLTVSNNGQTATATTGLTVNPVPTATLVTSGPLSCAQTSVTLTAGEGSSYGFSGPGLVSQNPTSSTAVANATGIYSVTVTNANGCSSTAITTVTGSTSAPTSNLTNDGPLSCAKPSVTLTASGGGTYQFSSGTSQVNGSNTATVSQAGIYSVTVTGANGCTSLASTTVTGSSSAPTASLTNNGPISCSTTSVTLTASGGDTYQFSSVSTQLNGGNTATVSTAGIYSVTVLSANGCSAVASTTVSGDQSVPQAGLTNNGPLSCTLISVTLTASGGGTYQFSSGASQVGTGNTATVSTAGVYSVTVTGANGCSATAVTTVTGSTSAPSASLTNDGPLSCTKTSVTLTASGGETYLFSPGITASGSSATVTTAGVYSVTVTNTSGCSAVTSTTVTQAAAPTLITGQPTSQTVTQGQTASFSITASGGLLTYQWQVDTGTGFVNLTSDATYSGVTTATLTVANTTTALSGYRYQVIVSSGVCSATSTTATLTVLPAPKSDLTPILYARPTVLNGNTAMTVVVDLLELNGVTTTSPITLKINQDSKLTLSLPGSATSVGGRPVNNSGWSLSGPQGGYYTLTTTQAIEAGKVLSVGLEGLFQPGATSGTLVVSGTVLVEGEQRFNNNSDADKIDYFQQ